jgi:hypothetical protein
MERKLKITIPEPCHENWDKMTPKDNGRFCISCSKTVIDFTSMLPDEVQHFFIQNQNKKICGRFKNEQLESLIIQIPSRVLYTQTNYHKMFLLALFIAMGTTLFSCQNKDGNKQKIDKIEVVADSLTEKNISVKAIAVKENDSIPSPPTPPGLKTNTQKDPEIYHSMITGEIVPIDQNENSSKNAIDYDTVFNAAVLDVSPNPKGGMKQFYSFVNNNYVIPNKTEIYNAKIYVSFIIEKDGSLSTFKIRRDAGPGTGEEAIRVLKMSPKWNPGKLNNHLVRTSCNLPISFKQ